MIVPNEILLEEVASLASEGRDVELKAKGSSMLPFIVGDRDSVILRKAESVALRPGDIVLARRAPGTYVLHRIVAEKGNKITLRGDGNIKGTEVVSREDILCIVIAVISPSGRTRIPGKAVLWRHLSPFARHCILALYKRTVYKIICR